MAHKQVLFRSAAREKILRGATQLADAIRVTLGPRSKSASVLLLTEATMTEIPETKKDQTLGPEMAM